MIDLYQEKNSKFDYIKNWFAKTFSFLKDREHLFYYAIALMCTGFGFYLLMIIENNFTSPWGGDYVMQYIPFAFNYYDDWMYFLKTGIFPNWDPNIFLGADAVTSDGYYIMFSPFFIPLLWFPRAWIPTILVFISVFRMVLAGLFFRLYLKKLGISERFARIGGIAYAFCGYVAYFIWFNNFLDIVVLLAAILWGIELVLKDKKPWVLALSLGILGVDNFFFFPCIVIITFIYSLFRFFQLIKQHDNKTNWAILGSGFVGYVLAIMIGSCLLIPGLITGMSDPKIEGVSYIMKLQEALKNWDLAAFFNLLFNWNAVDKGGWVYQSFPIMELFFPPVTCRHGPLVSATANGVFDNNASSLWVGTPILLFFIPAVIDAFKNKKVSAFVGIGIFLLTLFTPFSYILLFGGAVPYSRWHIIFPACMIAFVINYLDKNKDISIKTITAGYGFVLFGVLLSGVLAHMYVENGITLRGASFEYYLPYPGILFIMAIYTTFVYVIFLFHYHKKVIKGAFYYFVNLEAIVLGIFVTVGHGSYHPDYNNGGTTLNSALYDTVSKINAQDDSFYRMYTTLNVKTYSDNNQNMNNYNGASMFNTLYNYNTRGFKYWSNLGDGYDGWSGTYFEKRQSMDQFLGMKYYAIEHNDLKEAEISKNTNPNYQMNVPFGQVKNEKLSNDKFTVFENENINTIGYGLDQAYVYKKDNQKFALDRDGFNVLRNEDMYLKDAIMYKEDYDKLPDDVKADVPSFNSPRYISDLGYNNIKITDMMVRYETGDPMQDAPYIKNYYLVDSDNFDINKVGKIPSLKQPLNYYEINLAYGRRKINPGDIMYFITNKDPSLPIQGTENGGAIYVKALYKYQYLSEIYLLDKNGGIITYDTHSHNKGVDTGWKEIRGFYSDIPVYGIAFRPLRGEWPNMPSQFDSEEPLIMSESKSHWQSRLDSLNPLTNVNYKNVNTFTFDSNFDKTKLVATNIAYERGWKVYGKKDNDENYQPIDTFLAQGGFVGFVAPEGNMHYYMEYMNPEFAWARHISATGYSLVLISYAGYVIIDNERQRKRCLFDINFHS